MVLRPFQSLDFSECPTGIKDALAFLVPKPSPWNLVKLGGHKDGAYLVPSELQGVKACISPGVRNSKFFEDQIAIEYGISSVMVDFTSEAQSFATPIIDGMQSFHKKWLGIKDDDSTVTLGTLIRELELSHNEDLMLQMDIEGAEWPIFAGTKEGTLRRFRYIVVELHKLDDIFSDPVLFEKKANEAFKNLQKSFVVIHAHPNNCCGSSKNLFGSGMRIPRTLELTLVRRDFLEKAFESLPALTPELPHKLDIQRNVPGTPPVFLGNGWRHGRPNFSTVLRMARQSLTYELLWRWKRLIPKKLYLMAKKSIPR